MSNIKQSDPMHAANELADNVLMAIVLTPSELVTFIFTIGGH